MVIFSYIYAKFENEFGIKRNESVETYTSPDDKQRILAEGVEMEFYLKKFTDYHILMTGRVTTDNIIFDYPLKIKNKYVEDAKDKKPLALIHSIAIKYGLDLYIGNESSKFIYNQFIPVDPINPTTVIVVNNPDNHQFMGPFWYKITKDNDKFIAQCSLIYCIDMTEYLKSLDIIKKGNLLFGDQFWEFSEKEFGITAAMVEETVSNPDKDQELNLQGFRFKLYTKQIGDNYLLVQSRIENNEIIQIAYWIKNDLISRNPSDLNSIEPLEMLGDLVSNFGLTITVGTKQGQLLSDLIQFVRIPENQSHKIINVSVPKNHKFFKSDENVKSTKQNGGYLIQAGLMYYLDVTNYLEWFRK